MEDIELTKRERRELAREEREKERMNEDRSHRFRGIFVGLVIFAIIGFAGYEVYNFFTAPTPEVVVQPIQLSESDWVRGDRNSRAKLIEYGDFQCPACVNYYPLIEKLSQDINSDFAFVYRHFPLTSIHPNAMPAAKAAEAVGKQGKFWEMYKLLYEKNKEWVEEKNVKERLTIFAEELQLDKEQFLSDFDSAQVEEKVKADMLSGNTLRVNSTPTFFLNGKKIQPKSYEELKKLVEEEIRGFTTE